MSITRERADKALRDAERRERLRDAEQQAAWTIRRSRFVRLRSTNERDVETQHVKDSHTCFHDNPYTIACRQCGRSEEDARNERKRIALILGIAL